MTMNRTFASLPRVALLAALLALVLGLPSSADDRNLFLSNAEDPYLFMLLDTSGSMSFGLEKGWTNSYESTAVAAQLGYGSTSSSSVCPKPASLIDSKPRTCRWRIAQPSRTWHRNICGGPPREPPPRRGSSRRERPWRVPPPKL